jgi:AraC family transcriptional regulator
MSKLKPSRYEVGRSMLVAGLRRFHSFADLVHSIPNQWEDFQQLGPIPGQIGKTTYGVVCFADLEQQKVEYMSGVEVSGFDGLPPDLGRMRIPGQQRYAVFTHEGDFSSLKATWDAIWNEWLPSSGCQPDNTPDFEVYDEHFDRKTGIGGIEIWFPIKS